MSSQQAEINLILTWILITAGFVAGSMIGFNFRFFRDDHMGGYSSLKRRLYRLGHIAFFGMALVNFIFYSTVINLPSANELLSIASWALIVGGVSMPPCCFIMANQPRLKYLFYLPVSSLLLGSVITLWVLVVP